MSLLSAHPAHFDEFPLDTQKELWDRHRQEITRLHNDGATRLEILDILRSRYGFRPS